MSHHSNIFNTNVDVTILTAGSCTQLEKFITKKGKWRSIQIPALFAHIKHPNYGSILFDTGYSQHFYSASKQLPYSLYRYVTPVSIPEGKNACDQLMKIGIQPDDINYIILSHFHADHIGAVRQFSNARFIYLQQSYDNVKKRNSLMQTKAGFLPDLLPNDFEERSKPINEQQSISLPSSFPFKRGLDLFGDQSIIAVDLPGHAAGQIGILLTTAKQPYFFCADAVWETNSYKTLSRPHWLTNLIVDRQREAKIVFQQVCKFHEQHPEFRIVPSHCRHIWQSILEEDD